MAMVHIGWIAQKNETENRLTRYEGGREKEMENNRQTHEKDRLNSDFIPRSMKHVSNKQSKIVRQVV